MIVPLLQTKLHIPSVRPEQVSRPRLIDRLNAGLRPEVKLTLLSAPAGFGKTTLLAEWIHTLRSDPTLDTPGIAWLSIDQGDNDPARFWSYAVAALQAAEPGLGQRALTLLQSAGSTGPPAPSQTETMLTVLINEIVEADHPLILVLDDYHLIEAPSIHQAMAFLLDHLPHDMHLAIATRADPALPLSRLRGRNALIELRASDLCFASEQAERFLNRSMGLNLSPEQISALNAHTEGWIVGLQMAALALRTGEASSASPESFLSGLVQTQRYILDYLADEVFAQQPFQIQAFLLRTCVLDRLCGPLCDALIGDRSTGEETRSGQDVLQRLAHANLFVMPLDDRLEWYRYHPLFADLLRKRLEQREPGLASQLRSRASEWHERNGFVPEAIDYALAAADFARAAGLMEQHAEASLMHGENATVLRWVESLPDDLVLAHARLCVFHAWALLLNGRDPEVVESRLADVARHAMTDDIDGAVAALRSGLSLLKGRTPEAIRLAQQAMERLPPARAFLRSVAANNLGMAHVMNGDIDAAGQAFDQVIGIAQRAGNVMMTVVALCNVAGLRVLRGQLRRALTGYQRALDLSNDQHGRRLPVAARALLGLGELSREWNDLPTASRHLTEALALCVRYGELGSLICYLTLARINLAQGDQENMRAMMREARAVAAGTRATQVDDLLVAAAQARLSIAQGRTDTAAEWARERGLDRPEGSPGPPSAVPTDSNVHELEQVILSRLYLAQGRPDRALDVLQPLERTAERLGRVRRRIEVLSLQALALQMCDRIPDALSVLQLALSLAMPEGYVRTFLDEGEPMARLLYRAIQSNIERDYARRLLAVFDRPLAEPSQTPPSSSADVLVEPLSDRELEVLQLIAQGHSNQLVAQTLFLSLNTVKGHTRKIYGKLGVHSRTQAVARAKTLGLLPQG